MTELSFEHVSGIRRGEIDVVTTLPATIGSETGSQVRVPGSAPRHAQILGEGNRVVLLDSGSGQDTLLAGEAVHQVVLHDGDILQLGPGGPRLRSGAAAKLVFRTC